MSLHIFGLATEPLKSFHLATRSPNNTHSSRPSGPHKTAGRNSKERAVGLQGSVVLRHREGTQNCRGLGFQGWEALVENGHILWSAFVLLSFVRKDLLSNHVSFWFLFSKLSAGREPAIITGPSTSDASASRREGGPVTGPAAFGRWGVASEWR